jgi:hypothetical protein
MSSADMHQTRMRLDSFGYVQPFGPESLALVNALLADLVQTTQSLKDVKVCQILISCTERDWIFTSSAF